jgi:mannose-6-phosphate isomerase-like protein (cupin superfamily)
MSASSERGVSRRAAVLGTAGCAVGLLGPRAARASAPSSAELLSELEVISASLHAARLDGVAWQRRVTTLLSEVDPTQLRAALELDWRSIAAKTRREGRAELRLEPGELRGTPEQPHFRPKLFSLRQGRAILPHAHRHIASVFVVLDGRARGRHYDRLREEPDAILIRPSDDRSFAPGDCAAISDLVDNVHWFTALEDQTVLLNFSVTVPPSLRADGSSSGRVYLDPEGEQLADGAIRAPRAKVSVLRAKYEAG